MKKARKNKITFTVDLLGEATLSEKEAQEYLARYLELIQWLAQDAKSWDHVPQIDEDENGPIPKVNVSVKVTALYSQIDEAAWQESIEIVKDRVRQVFRTAMAANVFINNNTIEAPNPPDTATYLANTIFASNTHSLTAEGNTWTHLADDSSCGVVVDPASTSGIVQSNNVTVK